MVKEMGREWKHHKYLRKEGKRYYYKSVESITGIESPDLEEASESLDKIEPIKKIRDVLDTPIYSPNKEDETLITSAIEKLDGLVEKHKNTKLFAGGN